MNILVTGASKGIGKAIADELSADNNVFAAARNEKLLQCYKNYCVCDLAVLEDLEKLGNYIEEHNIDVLINNAGEYIYGAIDEI